MPSERADGAHQTAFTVDPEQLCRQVIESIVEADPAPESGDRRLATPVRVIVSAALYAMERRTHLPTAVRAALREQGACWARERRQQDGVLSVVHRVFDLAAEHVRCIASELPASHETVLTLGDLLTHLRVVERQVHAAVGEGFQQDLRRYWHPDGAPGPALLQQLVSGQPLNAGEVVEQARRVGGDLCPPCILLLARTIDPGRDSELAEHFRILEPGLEASRVLFTLVDDVPWHAVILGPLRGGPFPAWLRSAGKVAIERGLLLFADRIGALEELPRRYRELRDNFDAVQGMARGPGIVNRSEIEPLILVNAADPTHQLAYVDATLGPVLRYRDSSLASQYLHTLDLFFDHVGGIRSTAGEAFTHENTVRQRLDRIRELTGLCVRDRMQRLQLDTALLLLRIRGHEIQGVSGLLTTDAGGSQSWRGWGGSPTSLSGRR